MPPTLHALGPAVSDGAPTRVLIAEGQGLVRAGLRALLERRDDMCVVAEAASGEDAVASATALRPDVVLMDVGLPGLGGLEATRRILADMPPAATRVLMLIAGESDEAGFEALRAGATGLLLKDAGADALVDGVRLVADGETLLVPRLARRLVDDFRSRPERPRSTPEQLAELTAREREVMALVACGLSNQDIAERLVIARATAKTHVSRAMCKLDARDRAQLVVLAYESGIVRPGVHLPRAPEHASRSSVFARSREAHAALRVGAHRLAA